MEKIAQKSGRDNGDMNKINVNSNAFIHIKIIIFFFFFFYVYFVVNFKGCFFWYLIKIRHTYSTNLNEWKIIIVFLWSIHIFF